MRHKALLIGMLISCSSPLILAALYDILVFSEARAYATALIDNSRFKHNAPPEMLEQLLSIQGDKQYGTELVAKRLLALKVQNWVPFHPIQFNLACLVIWFHFTEREISILHLELWPFFRGKMGYSNVSALLFEKPIERLSDYEIAKLVALERMPSLIDYPMQLNERASTLLRRQEGKGSPKP